MRGAVRAVSRLRPLLDHVGCCRDRGSERAGAGWRTRRDAARSQAVGRRSPVPDATSRAELIDAARASELPGGRRHRAGRLRQVDPAGRSGPDAEDRRVAWVSLDRFDDDPAILLTLLASAYARVSPGDADLVADMRGLGVSVLGRAAPRLASALRTSPDPFVLMLDDLHELRRRPVTTCWAW